MTRTIASRRLVDAITAIGDSNLSKGDSLRFRILHVDDTALNITHEVCCNRNPKSSTETQELDVIAEFLALQLGLTNLKICERVAYFKRTPGKTRPVYMVRAQASTGGLNYKMFSIEYGLDEEHPATHATFLVRGNILDISQVEDRLAAILKECYTR